MSDVAQNEDGPQTADGPSIEPPAKLVAAQAIRFCNRCGTPWQVEWEQCQSCVQRAQTHVVAADLTYSEERRSIVQATALYACLLSVSIIATVVAAISGQEIGFRGLLVEEIAFCALVLGWAIAFRSMVLPLITRRVSWRTLLTGPAMGVLTCIVAAVAVAFIDRFSNLPNVKYLELFTDAGHGLGIATLFIAVEPAIFEELAFRGVILGSLQRVISSTEAIFVSGAMFAILHLSIPSFFHLFLMGVVLAWLRLRSGSLIPCMLLHFTHNFLVLLNEQWSFFPW